MMADRENNIAFIETDLLKELSLLVEETQKQLLFKTIVL